MNGRLATLKRIALGVLITAAFVYLGDDLSLQFRWPNHREQFGSVLVERLDAIPQKNGKTEFVRDDPENQVCVYSLFPHLGYPPCWYAARHTKQEVKF